MKISLDSSSKRIFSIVLVWLFTISGIIGITMGYEEWFLSLTPLNLLLYFGILLWNCNWKHTTLLLCIPIIIGWGVEFLGVQYGWVFGTYAYGQNLGYKIAGVPLIIGVNWAILTYCTAAIANFLGTKISLPNPLKQGGTAILAALLMTGLDLIIEVSAPRFDFWEFKNGHVPLQNYIGWFITAVGIQLIFQQLFLTKIRTYQLTIATHVFLAIFTFFGAFLFL